MFMFIWSMDVELPLLFSCCVFITSAVVNTGIQTQKRVFTIGLKLRAESSLSHRHPSLMPERGVQRRNRGTASSDTQRGQEVGPQLLPSGRLCRGSQGPGGPVFEVGCRKTLAWDKTPQKSWQQARHYRHPPTKIRGHGPPVLLSHTQSAHLQMVTLRPSWRPAQLPLQPPCRWEGRNVAPSPSGTLSLGTAAKRLR